MRYAVRFDFPEAPEPVYAGLYRGAWGWAPTLRTAELFDDADTAARTLANGYGESTRRFGRVIAVDEHEYPTESL